MANAWIRASTQPWVGALEQHLPTHTPRQDHALVYGMPLDIVMRGVAWAAGGVQGQAGALNSGTRCSWRAEVMLGFEGHWRVL